MTELHLVKDAGGEPKSALELAVAPLRREYLRRLAEMAGRVQPAALLREATTRDDQSGQLISGNDGLPLLFDVADRETGSTFEVRSARFDEPAEKHLRVGALDLELRAGCWEALTVDCRFSEPPPGEDAVALASLLRAFAELGHGGAFCARGAAEPWAGRIHGVAVSVSGTSVSGLYDMGTCPAGALDVLVRALDGFGRDRTPIARAIIGGAPPDPARTL